jgi:hypothetical protein
MTTLPITITAENLPLHDLIFSKISARYVWEDGADRLEIDEKPSYSLQAGQEVRLVVSLESLEQLVEWVDERKPEFYDGVLALYRQAEKVEAAAARPARAATRAAARTSIKAAAATLKARRS